MKLINVLYPYDSDSYDYDDADILLVPDFVHDHIEDVVQTFFDWTASTREHGYFVPDEKGGEVLAVGTDEFVKYLNDNYFQSENQETVVVKAHTKYNAGYPSAEF
ncbi:MAG: hypothetical protein LBL66_09515 [Clostridiales bacterium]|jgi:hypothetical protein|nr:hypothetical protein [Clostridiales bacterium]